MTIAAENTRAPRSIPVRRPTFDFERIRDRHWFGGDAFQTHLLNALSLTFPEGERFFMDSVRHFVPHIESPALKHEVSRFLAQEAMHGRVHVAFNEWIRALGNDTEWIENEVRENLAFARRQQSPRKQLAVTCALEHFTAILAEVMLENEELRAQLPPEIRELWIWHAVEETEHKSVAFDTYVAVGGTYRMRVGVMLLITVFFLTDITRYQIALMKRDPARIGKGSAGVALEIARGWFRMWVAPGIFRPVVPAYLDYFRPGFHPWQRLPKSKFSFFRDAMDARAAKGAPA